MTNPFERDDAQYHALVNEEGQHSLWPVDIDVPAGWAAVMTGARAECLEYIETHWRDLRPRSLIAFMDENR